MRREKALSVLLKHRDEIQRRFGVKHLALFGSVARGSATDASDVDVLVEFFAPATFDNYMDLKAFLEALFGTAVDLVTPDAIKPRMRAIIEKDLLRVA